MKKNCDVFTHSEDFCIVTTRNYDFSLVVMRNCVAVFRNYGSQCDRSYAPTASQFDRNETHEIFVTFVKVCFFVRYLCYHRGGGATAAGVFKYIAAWQRCGEAFSSGGVATYLAILSRRGSGAALILLKTYVAPQHR